MDKIYYLGTVPPFANGVYRLKVGTYAKFADGNWYTPAVTYKEALLVQDLAPDYKPEYRKADSDMWCEIAYRKFVGSVQTDMQGSACEFEFELPVSVSDAEIAEEAREAALNHINWNYREVPA